MVIALVIMVAGVVVWLREFHSLVPDNSNFNATRIICVSNAKSELENRRWRAPKTGYRYLATAKLTAVLREVILWREILRMRKLMKMSSFVGCAGWSCTPVKQFNFSAYEKPVLCSDWSRRGFERCLAKGAQHISPEEREKLWTIQLNLLAVDGPANQAKENGDATRLPSNKSFSANTYRATRSWNEISLVGNGRKSAMSGILGKVWK